MTLITIALAGVLVSIGMAGYAKVQRWCFVGGLIGFAVIVILLLFNSHANFVAAFNREGQNLFGVKNAYAARPTWRRSRRATLRRRSASARSGRRCCSSRR